MTDTIDNIKIIQATTIIMETRATGMMKEKFQGAETAPWIDIQRETAIGILETMGEIAVIARALRTAELAETRGIAHLETKIRTTIVYCHPVLVSIFWRANAKEATIAETAMMRKSTKLPSLQLINSREIGYSP
jgi:hypothetical protein